MKRTPHVSEGPSFPDFSTAPGLMDPVALAPPQEHPDARVFLTDGSGSAIAFAALWWRETPVHEGRRVAAIGGFDAIDVDAARELLEACLVHLRSSGCQLAVGPMNGNTWRRHRFVVESQGRGPFLLEPRNPAPHPLWWQEAGFTVLSRYSSSLMPLDGSTTLPGAVAVRLGRSGVGVRKIDPAEFDAELGVIHAISLKAFAGNFLYTPLDQEDFLDAYRKVRDRIDPDLVMIAERGGVPCGFVFGMPDLEAAARGEKPALIVKTLAVDPESRCAGLGTLLVDELHRVGREKGYTEAIHALQHETNTSLKITGRHHGVVLRRYALLSRSL